MGQGIYKSWVFLPPDPSYKIGQQIRDVTIDSFFCKDGIQLPFALVRPESGFLSDYCVLYSHGNAEDLGQIVPLLWKISNEFGIAAASYDYLGYGPSRGDHYPEEIHCFRDIRGAYEHLKQYFEPEKIILFGRSLGS